MIKIKFVEELNDGYISAKQKRYEFREALRKYADVYNHDQYCPDPDLVIDKPDNIHDNRHRSRGYLLGVFISDIHGNRHYGVDPYEYIELLNESDYDVLFYRCPELHGFGEPLQFFDKIDKPSVFVPWSIDPEKFKPNSINGFVKKDIDVAFIGATYSCYPLRKKIYESLKDGIGKYNVYVQPHNHWATWKEDEIPSNIPVGEEYRDILARSKIFIFGISNYKYILQKHFESPASGCLTMCDEPQLAESIGYIDGDTYVEINEDNWMDRLKYYLEDNYERVKIAYNGWFNAVNNHSHDRRAKYFVDIIEGMI